MKKVTTILDDLTNDEKNQDDKAKEEKPDDDPIKVAMAAYNDIKIPDKMMKDVPFAVLNYALEKSGN